MGRLGQLALVTAASLHLLTGFLRAGNDQAAALCQSGDALFRQAKFDGAGVAYRSALSADPTCARAHWGLGRLAGIHSRGAEARERFAAAYQLDPLDPDIVISCANWTEDVAARLALMRRFLKVSSASDVRRREDILARIGILERTGNVSLGRIVSPEDRYQIKLDGFYPDGQTRSGVQIKARIGDSKVRLVLDTGADGVLISSRAAKGAGLSPLSQAAITGFGKTRRGGVSLAPTVEIGNLRLEDVLVRTVEGELAPGTDGVIGSNVFQDFLIRIDLRSAILELIRHPWEIPQGDPGAIAALRFEHLLLVPASAEHAAPGYFLLDTGSSFNGLPANVRGLRQDGQPIHDAARPLTSVLSAPVSFNIAGRQCLDQHAVALDLQFVSAATGAEVSGIIGYPLLRGSVLSIDYRTGKVRIDAAGAEEEKSWNSTVARSAITAAMRQPVLQ